MVSKDSVPHSQEPTTCPHSETDQSSPSPPHSNAWRSTLIYSVPCGLFPSGFPTKTLYTSTLSHCATWLSLILFYLISQITFGEYTPSSSSVCSLLHSTVTSSHLGPNIILCTLFSNILSTCSFLNMSNQVLHPHKTRGKIIVLYTLIFIFLDSKLEGKKMLHWMIASIPHLQSVLNFFLNGILIY
jgi:hypothetical protein